MIAPAMGCHKGSLRGSIASVITYNVIKLGGSKIEKTIYFSRFDAVLMPFFPVSGTGVMARRLFAARGRPYRGTNTEAKCPRKCGS